MKVLVVDDSVVYRTAIKTALAQNPEVSEVKVAGNGRIAVQLLQQESYDAMTLDLEMPVMDGMETIKAVREFNKDIPIIIFSAQNLNAANKTLMALEMGANDFVQKIEGSGDLSENLKMIEAELVPKFRAFIDKLAKSTAPIVKANHSKGLNYRTQFAPQILCIGSSTGGPETLKEIFSKLSSPINMPVLIVQHMPPIFTTQLANALNDVCSVLEVKEAQDGDLLKPGHCYIAPGDFHMEIVSSGVGNVIRLNQGPKVCYVRPSVDVTLSSLVDNFQGNIASFILTGMGNDGADGCEKLKRSHKGIVVIQDEKSSVVFGMPKAVYDLDVYDDICSLEELPSVINDLV